MIFFPIHQLSGQQWQAYYKWFQRITPRYMPREWTGSWELFKQRKYANAKALSAQEYVWEQDGQPIAWLRMEMSSGEPCFDWNVDPSFVAVPAPLLQDLCRLLMHYMKVHEQDKIKIETGTPYMPLLAVYAKGKLINRRLFYEFRKQETSYDNLHQKVKDYESRFPNVMMSSVINRPDDILSEYVDLYNIVAADIPRADEDGKAYASWPVEALKRLNESNRATGNAVYTGILRNVQGKMIGLTDLNVHLPHPNRMYQGMTGVHPDYRGNGFGTWLKLAMLQRIWAEFPTFEIIDTDCNVLNLPVQRMNERIGFVRTGEGWEYRLDAAFL